MASKLSSSALFKKASGLIPGGVNSPVRSFKPYPFFTEYAKGSKLHDVDGNKYVDYCMAYGAIIFGHSHPPVLEAVKKQLESGTVYGTPTEAEVDLAQLITDHVPCADMVRLANTGAEATMHAIRLARGFTGKPKLLKFEGCYHGAHDSVLVKAGSGATTFGVPNSLGIPENTAKNTVVLPYNDIETLKQTAEDLGDDLAAIIVEPAIGNMGVILPSEAFLTELKRTAEKCRALLIFDEVITGFRLALGGAEEYYGVRPDIVTLGKVLGGGFPISAVVGKKKVMESFSPIGGVYEAGTFSGNPISVSAAIATLSELEKQRSRLYNNLEGSTSKLVKNLRELFTDKNLQVQINQVASMFTIFFTNTYVTDSKKALTSDKTKFNSFHQSLLRKGVFFPPSQFETCFVSSAHTEEDLEHTVEAVASALNEL
ncbi:MAG: glutamate-1-semialdehyde 2,1-aminomutase [Candidatus Bathyarchaeota archaeon]|jgi:glutamate-1-semialdehyde 2,1-aminomutase|nr:glutamate-1-semialdehyde 2,1-aminomutase [Candidatus Bathyarchaeota archaeon]